MANPHVPTDLRFLKSDEWVRVEGSTATIGISDFAQEQLNDIVFVELPEVGRTLAQGDSLATVESVKAASDIYTPVAGTISEVNTALQTQPELINSDPYGRGWIVRLTLTGDASNPDLMDAAAYTAYLQTR
jgi:glycine cleavage system H protein